jgi:hypothetical protein
MDRFRTLKIKELKEQGYTYEEISSMLHISKSDVSKALKTAIRHPVPPVQPTVQNRALEDELLIREVPIRTESSSQTKRPAVPLPSTVFPDTTLMCGPEGLFMGRTENLAQLNSKLTTSDSMFPLWVVKIFLLFLVMMGIVILLRKMERREA